MRQFKDDHRAIVSRRLHIQPCPDHRRALAHPSQPQVSLGHKTARLHAAAARGEREQWLAAARPALALAILLDQFPRNMYRGTPHAFASDPQALAVARAIVAHGLDRELLPVQRWFVYLPFEHAEDIEAQRESLRLFASLGDGPDAASVQDYAQRHHDVIARFGRFPHRNAILGRESTPEEVEFLAQPGSSF